MKLFSLQEDEKTTEFKMKLKTLREKPTVYECAFDKQKIPVSLTFDDILLVPQYGEINSRSQCDISSKFSHHVPLNLPIVSSPMDTVTESAMAIEMARQGGLGVIHRFMPIEDQAHQIQKVKRSGMFVNIDPISVSAKQSYSTVKQMMTKYGISSFLVTQDLSANKSPRISGNDRRKLVGILTKRDILCMKFDDQCIDSYMTPIQKVISYQVAYNFNSLNCDLNAILQTCKQLLIKNKIEKIPLLTSQKVIMGLVSLQDIQRYESIKSANKDNSGRLFVGGAVGANKDYIERAKALKDVGCDVLVVDVANGHSKLAMNATEELKEHFPTLDVVSGSIATGQGAQNLIRSGADGIRCGIGNGSICITRVVAGSGVPQLSAIKDTAPVCQYYDVPLCSDGGNKNSGNMCKALAMGANSIMVGRLVAGCEESPGISFHKDGKFVKMYRGMAGLGANIAKQERNGGENLNPQTFNSEGVQGYTPFIGPLNFVLQGFSNGIRSGMSYTGAHNLQQHRKKARFTQITQSGFKESNVHGITKF